MTRTTKSLLIGVGVASGPAFSVLSTLLLLAGCVSSMPSEPSYPCSGDSPQPVRTLDVDAASRIADETLREHLGKPLPSLYLTPSHGPKRQLSEFYGEILVVALIPTFDAHVLKWVEHLRESLATSAEPSRILVAAYDTQPGDVLNYLRTTDDAYAIAWPFPDYLRCIRVFPIALVIDTDGALLGYGWTVEEAVSAIRNREEIRQ